MTIDTKLRDAAASIREARHDAEFTVTPPGRRRRQGGAKVALAGAVVVALSIGVPALMRSTSEPDEGRGDVATGEGTRPTTMAPTSIAAQIAADMGGELVTADRLRAITGLAGDVGRPAYLVASTTTPDGSYEIGLVVHDRSLPEGPTTCLTNYAYAVADGVPVVGGSVCASDPDAVADLAAFHLSIGGSCGGGPKESPVVDGVWTLLTVWGIPETTTAVTIRLADGSTVDVDVDNGVAGRLWEAGVGIESLDFDGITPAQQQVVSSYLPAQGIDC